MDIINLFAIWGKFTNSSSLFARISSCLFTTMCSIGSFQRLNAFLIQSKCNPSVRLLGLPLRLVQNRRVWWHIFNRTEETTTDLPPCLPSLHRPFPLLLHGWRRSSDYKMVLDHELFRARHHVHLLCNPDPEARENSEIFGNDDHNFTGNFSSFLGSLAASTLNFEILHPYLNVICIDFSNGPRNHSKLVRLQG